MGGVGEQDVTAAPIRARQGTRPPRWRAAALLLAGALAATACEPPGADAQPARSLNVRAPSAPAPGVSPQDPFRGSPAYDYGNGAAGIRPPAAKPVAGFSASQVRDHLQTVKRALILANLDQKVWQGARPTALIKLFDPRDGYRTRVTRTFGRPSAGDNPLTIATRFKPSEATVHGEIVKVRGKMTFRGMERGRLRVHADYLFVYAVRPAGGPVRQVERVVVRRTTDYDFYDPARFQVTPGTFVLAKSRFRSANAKCDQDDGFIHPSFNDVPADGSIPSGAPIDPYDLNNKGNVQECRPTSRT
jgi:hypothetical protein